MRTIQVQGVLFFMAGYLTSSVLTRLDRMDFDTMIFPAGLFVVVVLALLWSVTQGPKQ